MRWSFSPYLLLFSLYFKVLSGSSEAEEENDPDGPFAFRRKTGCQYYAVSLLVASEFWMVLSTMREVCFNSYTFFPPKPHLDQTGDWPWSSPKGGTLGNERYRYCLTTLTVPQRCIGLARRRVGRGGR